MVKNLIKWFFLLLGGLSFSVMFIGLFFEFINMAMVGFIVMWFAMYVLLKIEGVR